MTNGVILAGGRGSRLGPMAAQISKALVPIGQRPHLAHQVELLREQGGCDVVVVVTGPDTDKQVRAMLERSGLTRRVSVSTAVQGRPLGPVDAIRVGLEHESVRMSEPTYVLMADTYLDDMPGLDVAIEQSWVAYAEAPYTRSFCFLEGGQFVDGTASKGKEVTVGAYRFRDTVLAYEAAASTFRKNYHQVGQEVGMAPFLNEVVKRDPTLVVTPAPTWRDLGDLRSLATARNSSFISRETHDLKLGDDGTITKRGSTTQFARQSAWMGRVSNYADRRVSNLLPRVYTAGTLQYTMEFIDLPTLSELWLYWPGRPDVWAYIIETVIDACRPLWEVGQERVNYDNRKMVKAADVADLFVAKAESRVEWLDKQHGSNWSTRLRGLLSAARDWFEEDDLVVFPHGDLNFNNVLFSLNSSAVKLVDPRGDERLPRIYEYAKLRYSYHAGFSAITHHLTNSTKLLPERVDESRAIDEVLAKEYDLDTLTVAEALLLLAGSPLHARDEAQVMVRRGYEMLEELL